MGQYIGLAFFEARLASVPAMGEDACPSRSILPQYPSRIYRSTSSHPSPRLISSSSSTHPPSTCVMGRASALYAVKFMKSHVIAGLSPFIIVRLSGKRDASRAGRRESLGLVKYWSSAPAAAVAAAARSLFISTIESTRCARCCTNALKSAALGQALAGWKAVPSRPAPHRWHARPPPLSGGTPSGGFFFLLLHSSTEWP